VFRALPVGLVVVLLLLAGGASARTHWRSSRAVEVGAASYIAPSLAGEPTASGVPFDPREMVAAHRTLPFQTRLRVTNLENGRHAVVTVVDRGPFYKGRILDVSPRAARALGFMAAGTTQVRVEVLSGR
jgi:rare lipoprotein A